MARLSGCFTVEQGAPTWSDGRCTLPVTVRVNRRSWSWVRLVWNEARAAYPNVNRVRLAWAVAKTVR